MQKPKNSKKQNELPPSGNKPKVLQAKVLSPHEIEKEILLKKIESLQYAVREKERQNQQIREASSEVIEKQRNQMSSLLDLVNSSVENCRKLAEINHNLIQSKMFSPQKDTVALIKRMHQQANADLADRLAKRNTNQLIKDFIVEMNAKNEAYYFILSSGNFDSFKKYCYAE